MFCWHYRFHWLLLFLFNSFIPDEISQAQSSAFEIPLGQFWMLVVAKIKSSHDNISAATFCCTLKQHLSNSHIIVGMMH